MCFSAGASFGASAVILVVSVASFKKATSPAQKVLACIPLFFAIQQAIEGALWLSLQHAEYDYLYRFCTYAFLALALVVWPAMIPLTALLPERDARRRKVLKLLLAAGVLVSLAYLYCLLSYGATARAQQHHISYELLFPQSLLSIGAVVYFIPALIPPLLSSHWPVRLIGLALVLSYAVTRIFYQPYIISVWCYFATVISLVALLAIIQLNKAQKAELRT